MSLKGSVPEVLYLKNFVPGVVSPKGSFPKVLPLELRALRILSLKGLVPKVLSHSCSKSPSFTLAPPKPIPSTCSLLAPPGSILISEPWLCPAALGCLVLCATDPGVLLELPEQDVAAAAPAGLGPGPAVQLVLLQFVEGQLDVTELAQHGAQGARGCLGRHTGSLLPCGKRSLLSFGALVCSQLHAKE